VAEQFPEVLIRELPIRVLKVPFEHEPHVRQHQGAIENRGPK
jgi:hypothetical protein